MTIGVALAVSTTVLGAMPTFAFSVLPALAAVRVSRNIPMSLVLAMLIGATSGFGGYVLAFSWELPVGATQTLVAAGFALITWPFGSHSHD